MVKKSQNGDPDSGANPAQFAESVKESAQQIWLAGLGAFAKAQEEGSKVFESLVKEGASLQRKTQSSAGEKLSEAASRMSAMANEFSARATGQWDKLEGLFEDRVARALGKLGVPSAREIEELTARVEELTRLVAQMNSGVRGHRAARKAAAGALGRRSPLRKPTGSNKA
ncbi:MAG TPA: phasin family protein [Ramlibacter sp.]|nr:phasin family protein [Ramlibacter sp.]